MISRHLAIRMLVSLSLFPTACSLRPSGKKNTSRPPASAGMKKPDRPITVESPHSRVTVNSCRVLGPYIAMTFDDGPHPEHTPRLLAMLRQRNLKATFYLIGNCVRNYPHVARQILADGHEIGNHTLTHAKLSGLPDAGVARELDVCNDIIADALGGYRPKVFRPPFGAITQRQKLWVLEKYGWSTILWSHDPEDWKPQYRNGPIVARHILEGHLGSGPVRSGSIILAHDIHKSTVDAMPVVFDGLLARGFKFVTTSELLELEKRFASPQPQYSAVVPTTFTAGSM